MLFDDGGAGTPVELDPQPGSKRRGAAIGGSTVSWIDVSVAGGEVYAFDLGGGAPVRLTNDAVVDRRAAVAPSGTMVVWEQCATLASPCDIHKAVKSGASWTVSAVSATADTNGTLAAYHSVRATSNGGSDIYWTDLTSGTETQLSIAGPQGNPAIAGDLIAFESFPSSSSTDVYVFNRATNTLYQLTNTPSFSEQLTDITLSGTTVRVVYSVFEADENVYGISFQLPSQGHTFDGFFAPVDNDMPNQAKAGQTIPVKWRLTDASGAPVSDPASFVSLTSGSTTCDPNDPVDQVEEYSGSSGLQYKGDGNWQFNWKTQKSFAGQCRVMSVNLSDGSSHAADFRFR